MSIEGRARGASGGVSGSASGSASETESLPKFEKVKSRDGHWYLACGEVITFLFEYLEEDLPKERRSEFDRHLAICPSCRNYLSTYRESLLLLRRSDQLEEVEIPALPQHLLDAIVRALGWEAPIGDSRPSP